MAETTVAPSNRQAILDAVRSGKIGTAKSMPASLVITDSDGNSVLIGEFANLRIAEDVGEAVRKVIARGHYDGTGEKTVSASFVPTVQVIGNDSGKLVSGRIFDGAENVRTRNTGGSED